jgi:FtsZ-binding cell division protein ZapB
MMEYDYRDLIEMYLKKIETEIDTITDCRTIIKEYKKEIERLDKELKQAQTTPEELGFEGNGVNCGVDE